MTHERAEIFTLSSQSTVEAEILTLTCLYELDIYLHLRLIFSIVSSSVA